MYTWIALEQGEFAEIPTDSFFFLQSHVPTGILTETAVLPAILHLTASIKMPDKNKNSFFFGAPDSKEVWSGRSCDFTGGKGKSQSFNVVVHLSFSTFLYPTLDLTLTPFPQRSCSKIILPSDQKAIDEWRGQRVSQWLPGFWLCNQTWAQ